jgi:hypothetical protein
MASTVRGCYELPLSCDHYQPREREGRCSGGRVLIILALPFLIVAAIVVTFVALSRA